MNGIAFEVVTKRKVAEHFEEGVVVSRDSDVADVAGAQTLLTGGRCCEIQLANSHEFVFELIHARRGE